MKDGLISSGVEILVRLVFALEVTELFHPLSVFLAHPLDMVAHPGDEFLLLGGALTVDFILCFGEAVKAVDELLLMQADEGLFGLD